MIFLSKNLEISERSLYFSATNPYFLSFVFNGQLFEQELPPFCVRKSSCILGGCRTCYLLK